MSVEEVEELLWLEPSELQLVEDSMEIQESKCEITDFWWASMGSTRQGDKREGLKNCKDCIHYVYGKLCGTSSINTEIPSTLQEDGEWIDLTFKKMQNVQPYSAWNPSMSLGGELSSVQLEKTKGDSYYLKEHRTSV